jgi:hypothetical protein
MPPQSHSPTKVEEQLGTVDEELGRMPQAVREGERRFVLRTRVKVWLARIAFMIHDFMKHD